MLKKAHETKYCPHRIKQARSTRAKFRGIEISDKKRKEKHKKQSKQAKKWELTLETEGRDWQWALG